MEELQGRWVQTFAGGNWGDYLQELLIAQGRGGRVQTAVSEICKTEGKCCLPRHGKYILSLHMEDSKFRLRKLFAKKLSVLISGHDTYFPSNHALQLSRIRRGRRNKDTALCDLLCMFYFKYRWHYRYLKT